MKLKSLLFVAALSISALSFGQAPADTTWKSGGLFSLGFQQVSLNNWAAGGFNSVSGSGLLSLFKNYNNGTISWDNTLDLGYGLLQQGEADAVKTDDKIDLASKLGRQAWNEHWYYSLLGNFKTQFTEGISAPDSLGQTTRISDFMAPAYGLLAAGLDYKPNDNFTLFLSPLTAKFTMVGDEFLAAAGAFGVDKGELGFNSEGKQIVVKDGASSRSEFGAYLKAAYKHELMKNINLMTKVDLFTNYKENPFTHTDVNWELLIGMKVNEYITANLGFTALYDHDIDITDKDGFTGPRTQFKEVFGIGFSYKL